MNADKADQFGFFGNSGDSGNFASASSVPPRFKGFPITRSRALTQSQSAFIRVHQR